MNRLDIEKAEPIKKTVEWAACMFIQSRNKKQVQQQYANFLEQLSIIFPIDRDSLLRVFNNKLEEMEDEIKDS